MLRTAAPLRAAAPGTPSAIRALRLQAALTTQRFAVHTQLTAQGAFKRLELHCNDQVFRPFWCSAFLQQLLRGWTSEAMLRSCALDLNRLALLLGHLLLSPFLLAAISSMTTISQAPPPLPPIYFEQQCCPQIANGGHSVQIRRSYDIALGVGLISWRTKLQHVGSVFCTRCMISTESNWENILAKYTTLGANNR